MKWWDEALEMRHEGLTYEEIGDQFGVTCERVRQVVRDLAPELQGVLDRCSPIECLQCGKFVDGPHRRTQKFCSRSCRALYAENHLTEYESLVLRTVCANREAGKTWCQIDAILGRSVSPYGSGLQGYFKRICAKVGIDSAQWGRQ